MNAKLTALVTLIAVLSAGTLGCPTDMPANTDTAPDTTEAPPVAVHTDTDNTDTTNTDNVVADPSDDTTTTTPTTDPNPTVTPIDPTTTDPNDGTTDPVPTDPPSSAISGTFAGTLTWQNSQFLAGGDPFPSGSDDAPINIEFDEDGVITAVFFRGFVDAPDGTAAVQQVGDKVTLSASGITQTVRVLETAYTENSAFLKVRVRHQKTEGQLVETGRGIQTIDISVSGNVLTYASTMTYEIALGNVGGVSIDAGEISTTSGTLQRE